MHFNSGCYFIV